MFVHSGPSLHGPDSKDQLQPQSPSCPLRFPFLPSSLCPISDVEPIPRTASASPTRNTHEKSLLAIERHRSAPVPHRRVVSESIRAKDATVRFRDQADMVSTTTVPSEDEESLIGSELSDQTETSSRLKRRKRAPRKSTRYALGFPAPQLRTKQRSFLQIRPRILLQLQELGERRAIPAFDVMPSSLIAGSLIIPKLAKKFPRMFHAKPYLGQDDLLLVRSEHYSPSTSPILEDSSEDNSGLDHRDVLAVVSMTPEMDEDYVEIVFQDGTTWVTSPMANGSYEFTNVKDNGEMVKARWVKRNMSSPRNSWTPNNAVPPSSPPPTDNKWTFSLIDPSTRRHPIQGVLNCNSLEIFDTYNTLSTSSGRYPPTKSFGSEIASSVEQSPVSNTSAEERLTLSVTEEHKKLMLATGIWISLRQRGWPSVLTPKFPRTMSQYRSASSNSVRSNTFPMSCGSSGASSPTTLAPPSITGVRDVNPSAPHPGVIRRAVSSGGEFMRRRREAVTPTSPTYNEKSKEQQAKEKAREKAKQIEDNSEKHRDSQKIDRIIEETPTCRPLFRRLTHKLFHPRSQRVS